MNSRRLLSGTLVALMMMGGASSAVAQESGGILGRIGLPGVFGGKKEQQPAAEPAQPNAQFAQSADQRLPALEEQVRQLSGTIEELNFQILQMQEQMRKMQEDNEFRFQELEKGGASGTGKTNRGTAKAPDATVDASGTRKNGTASTATRTTLPGGVEDGTAQGGQDPANGTQITSTLGTVTVDQNGNVTSDRQLSVGDVIDGEPMDGEPADGTVVASLPSAGSSDELYRNSYEFVLSGDYKSAEAGFRNHIEQYPSDGRAADAHFWLGESLLGQQKYRDAAEVFLAANKDYPTSKKAPDMLFKLGVSLAGLKQRDVACATFNEVGKRYPEASASLKDRLKQEKAAAGC